MQRLSELGDARVQHVSALPSSDVDVPCCCCFPVCCGADVSLASCDCAHAYVEHSCCAVSALPTAAIERFRSHLDERRAAAERPAEEGEEDMDFADY